MQKYLIIIGLAVILPLFFIVSIFYNNSASCILHDNIKPIAEKMVAYMADQDEGNVFYIDLEIESQAIDERKRPLLEAVLSELKEMVRDESKHLKNVKILENRNIPSYEKEVHKQSDPLWYPRDLWQKKMGNRIAATHQILIGVVILSRAVQIQARLADIKTTEIQEKANVEVAAVDLDPVWVGDFYPDLKKWRSQSNLKRIGKNSVLMVVFILAILSFFRWLKHKYKNRQEKLIRSAADENNARQIISEEAPEPEPKTLRKDASGVFDAWIRYLELENLEKSKLLPGKLESPQFIELQSGVTTPEGRFRIPLKKETVDLLKIKFPLKPESRQVDEDNLEMIDGETQQGQENQKQDRLFLYFPLIKKTVSRGRNFSKDFFHPLFAVDITRQKASIYGSAENPTLEIQVSLGNPYLALSGNFLTFLGLEKEDIEKNISLLGLVSAVTKKEETDFVQAMSGFREYLKKHLKNGELFYHEAVISDKPMKQFTEQLEKELEVLKGLPVKPGSVAHQYLFKISRESYRDDRFDTDKIWYGAFGKYPFSRGQAAVLQRVQGEERLMGVQGPPGTGKTTLLQSVIANQIVKRAFRLIETGQDINNLMAVVSPNNKAIDHVGLPFDDPDFKAIANSTNWVYFPGGNQERIRNSVNRIDALIKELRKGIYSPEKQNDAAAEMLALKKSLESERQEWMQARNEISKCVREGGFNALDKFQGAFEDAEKKALQRLTEVNEGPVTLSITETRVKLATENEQRTKTRYTLTEIDEKLHSVGINGSYKDIVRSMFAADLIEFYTKLSGLSFFQRLLKGGKHRIINKFVGANALAIERLGFPSLTPKNIALLAGTVNKCCLVYYDLQQESNTGLKSIGDSHLQACLNDIERYLGLQGGMLRIRSLLKIQNQWGQHFADTYRKQHVRENCLLFELSLRYMWQEMLKNKDVLIQALFDWKLLLLNDALTDTIKVKWQDRVEELARLVSMAYPLMTSTLASAHKLFNFGLEQYITCRPINLLLCDESGMAGAHEIFPLLYACSRALVVGDPRQIEPIIPLSEAAIEKYKEDAFGGDQEWFNRYSPTHVTAFHRASGCKTGSPFELGDALVLDEHRRCQPDIAELFVDVAGYHNLKIKTPVLNEISDSRLFKALSAFGGQSLHFFHVQGRFGKRPHMNIDEIDKIGEVLGHLSQAGFNLKKDVCIITPYKNQEEELLQRYRKRLGRAGYEKIGTLHKFQGQEFQVVIFSPTIFSPKQSMSFISDKPNMLNVAASRAKTLFIAVGNYNRLSQESGYLKNMCLRMKTAGTISGLNDIKVRLVRCA